MNKYLVKIAEKHELESGVMYDDKSHAISLTRDHRAKLISNAKIKEGLAYGTPYGITGGLIGFAVGNKKGIDWRGSTSPLKKKLSRVLPVLGSATGAAVLGGAMYGWGSWLGSQPHLISNTQNKFLSKMEEKHQEKIYSIHGWNK
jgi:hypothetical protein